MTPQANLFERAGACLRAGDLRQAEQLGRQAVEAQPGHAEAWHLLGNALQGQGKAAEAVAAFRRALQLRPDAADSHHHLGLALAASGQKDEAVAQYRQALRLRPGHPETLTNLGVTLAELGRLDEAVSFLREAVRLQPELAQAHHNLGVAHAQQGHPQEAVACLERALQLQPGYAEAAYNLGNVLRDLGRRDEALARFRQAVEARPAYGEALNNLGLLLNEAGSPAEAAVLLAQAVRLRPQAPEGHNNLGLALAELGRFAEAEAGYREALRLQPGYVDAHVNLGSAYKEQGRLEEALACYQVALWLNPQQASAHYNRSLALLQKGDYAAGWPAYEWRWKRPSMPPRPFRQSRWDGSPLKGKTILLYCEQGLGDTIQFIRYAPLVQQQGGTVVVECPGSLVPLLSSCPGIDRLVAEKEELPPFDVQAPLLSLPGLLKTTLESVPAQVPYLAAPAERVERWGKRLAEVEGFKVGVVWQGNPRFPWDRHRSMPLSCFAPLAAVAGVRLVSLQKGPGTEQIQALKGRFEVMDLGPELDAEGGAFLDTAAVMRHLDLVVSADTAAAHLAGALGVPVWLALAAIGDWRWLRAREDTPWYPTMRLFRQDRVGDWAGVFQSMAGELVRLKGSRGGGIRVEVSPGEMMDRITILEIKAERIRDPGKQVLVQRDLEVLRREREKIGELPAQLEELTGALRAVNEALWEVEDQLRLCEREADFGPRFIELARSVYRRNDERWALKKRIDDLLGSNRGEPKSYATAGESDNSQEGVGTG